MTQLQLAILLAQALLAQYKAAGAALSIISQIEAALTALLAARNMEVTEGSLEALRVEVPWDKS